VTPTQRARARFATYLSNENFDFDSPKPLLAWQAFKAVVEEFYLTYEVFGMGVEFLHVSDRDSTLYLEYGVNPDDEHEIGVGILFEREVPHDMIAVNKMLWREGNESEESVEEYFARVEATPEFKKCIALDDWECEWA
jgi:hypothetical protein